MLKVSMVKRLPGMCDTQQDLHMLLSQAAEHFRIYLNECGYKLVDTPILEDAELFVRKSGVELTRHMFTFVDTEGRRVTLRPEFTSSVIRHFIEQSDRETLPVRWQYSGPVFRYQPGNDAQYKQFNQVGAEFLGPGGVAADAEVVSAACTGLRRVGVDSFVIRIGHMGVLNDAFDIYGISERARLFIVSNVRALRTGTSNLEDLIRQAGDLGLLRLGEGLLPDNNEDLDVDGNKGIIREVLTGAMSGPTGRRTPDEIVNRLLRKLGQSDSEDLLERAIKFVGDLAKVEGTPGEALQKASDVFKTAGQEGPHLIDVGNLVTSLKQNGVNESQIKLDFGLARDLTYYTGVIFEITANDSCSSEPLCGGGRYDGLVKSLGGGNVPAAGFAYTLDRVACELNEEFVTNNPTSDSSDLEN